MVADAAAPLLYIFVFCRELQYAVEFLLELISYLFTIELPDSENSVFLDYQ